MATIKVTCPYCKSDKVVCNGKTKKGLQRYICKNEMCSHKTFQIEYAYNACVPGVREKIIDMAMNGSGVRVLLCQDLAQNKVRKNSVIGQC